MRKGIVNSFARRIANSFGGRLWTLSLRGLRTHSEGDYELFHSEDCELVRRKIVNVSVWRL